MTRGNQREKAREKSQKKIADEKRKLGSSAGANKGTSLEERRHRDAEIMRTKQEAKQAAKQGKSDDSSGGAVGGKA